MRFKTRAVAFLATAALIAPGLAACSSGSGGGTTLTWFQAYGDAWVRLTTRGKRLVQRIWPEAQAIVY